MQTLKKRSCVYLCRHCSVRLRGAVQPRLPEHRNAAYNHSHCVPASGRRPRPTAATTTTANDQQRGTLTQRARRHRALRRHRGARRREPERAVRPLNRVVVVQQRLVAAAAIANVAASMRSGTVTYGFPCEERSPPPMISIVVVPAPVICAPQALRYSATETISGSMAQFLSTVFPSARSSIIAISLGKKSV